MLIEEADFERACRAAARGVAPQHKRRVRPRAAAVDSNDGDWSVAGGSRSQTFWPRFGDICLAAAGVRCAVLLDSRRAPRRSPPLADVLLALQHDQQERQQQKEHCATRDCHSDCDCNSGGVACLGLLVLEGSSFLVNRVMLVRRLNELFSGETIAAEPVDERFRRSATCATDCDKKSGYGTEAVRPAVDGAASAHQRHFDRRDLALLDVNMALAVPSDRSDVLAPRLYAALLWAFGGATVAATANSVEEGRARGPSPTPPPRGTSRESTAMETSAKSNREDRFCGGDGVHRVPPSELEGGARWLRDWSMKELVLDCESLVKTLGDVGLSGMAGWLLEYPAIYCCSSLNDGTTNGSDGKEMEHARGNCLAAVPLTVYSLAVDLGDKGRGSSSRPQPSLDERSASVTGAWFEAFSFSVPEAMCGPTETEQDEDEVNGGGACGENREERHRRTAAALHGLVDNFVQTIDRRLARLRRSGVNGNDSFLSLNVSKRRATLDQVAL
ncbi:expressed unknown protein [Ectocarpus siliculosus]|uniref:Uncharacterized protein n=1 Tax=Ectocarpus siliculosus TaxID=2880 RepID=D7FQ91_ECTSI|nr:expressed unknown protein [Ectocarpus siliculosus]|eukprot:CBJ48423.1 expressed unknown protein [Ectocarpus siliculosus]